MAAGFVKNYSVTSGAKARATHASVVKCHIGRMNRIEWLCRPNSSLSCDVLEVLSIPTLTAKVAHIQIFAFPLPRNDKIYNYRLKVHIAERVGHAMLNVEIMIMSVSLINSAEVWLGTIPFGPVLLRKVRLAGLVAAHHDGTRWCNLDHSRHNPCGDDDDNEMMMMITHLS